MGREVFEAKMIIKSCNLLQFTSHALIISLHNDKKIPRNIKNIISKISIARGVTFLSNSDGLNRYRYHSAKT